MSDSNAPENEMEQDVSIKKAGPHDPKSSPTYTPAPVSPESKATPQGKGKASDWEGGKFMEETPNPAPSAKTGVTDVRDTYSGAHAPGSNKKPVIMRNGVPFHIHPGYPSNAKTLAEAQYHKVSQRHRGQNGKDITQQIHERYGLGKDGMGGMSMGIGQAISSDIASRGKGNVAASILGAVAMTGMDSVSNVLNSMFNLADAVMSGNPMSIASSIMGESIDVFSGIAEDYIKLQDKYRVPSNADENALMQTIMGRAFKGQVEAYKEGYGHAMFASNKYMDLAADMSIYVTADGKSLYEQYAGTKDVPLTKADMDDILRKREAYLSANKAMLDTFGTYDKLHNDALTDMDYTSLKAYADGIGERDKDYLDAMSDLITDNKVYEIDANGFIDKSKWRDASTMKQSEVDKYKIALQVGHKTSSEQLNVIAGKVKETYKRDRGELSRIRAEKREFDRRVKEIKEARMKDNIMDGGMHVKAVYDHGMDTEIEGDFNPTHAKTLTSCSANLQKLIDLQPQLRATAAAAGVTDPRQLKLYGVYSDAEVKDAEKKIEEWNLKAANLRAKHLESRKSAEATVLSKLGAVDRIKHRIKNLDPDGLPSTETSLNKYRDKLKAELSVWDKRGVLHPDHVVTEAELDKGVMDFANQVASAIGDPSKATEIYDRLNNSQSNSLYLKNIRNVIRSENIANASAKEEYAQVSNEAMKADVKGRLAALGRNYANPNREMKMDPTQFNSAMDELLKQYDEMAAGCDDASKNSELYSENKYLALMDKVSNLDSAVKNGSKVLPSDYAMPIGTYDYSKGEQRANLLKEIASEASKPDSNFYHGDERISDEEMSNLFGSNKNTISGSKNRDRMDRILSDMNMLGTIVDDSLPSNRYLAIAGMHSGDSPFEFVVNGSDKRSRILNGALQREVKAYDDYVMNKYGGDHDLIRDDDSVAFAMESHIQYLASKLALNESLRGDPTDPRKNDINEYSDIIDEQAKRDMLNLSYDATAKDFGAGRKRKDNASVKNDMELVRKLFSNPTDAGMAVRHYQEINSAALDNVRGYKDSLYHIASVVGSTHDAKLVGGIKGMDMQSASSFFGEAYTTDYKTNEAIQKKYGFDMKNNGIDQMAVGILKRAGIESLSELEGRGSDGYSDVIKRLDKIKKDYSGDNHISNADKEALVKATIVAKNTVTAMSARQAMINKLNEEGLPWIGNDPESKVDLLNRSEEKFNELFKIAKTTRWTANTTAGSLDNYSSITELSREDALCLAGSSIELGMLGIDASLGQGNTSSKEHQTKVKRLERYIKRNPLDREGIYENLIDTYSERIDKGGSTYFTLSGTLGGYQTGSVALGADVSSPISIFNTITEFFKGNVPEGGVTVEARNIWENKEYSNLLNLQAWNDANKHTGIPDAEIVDLAIMFVPAVDKDGNPIVNPRTGRTVATSIYTPFYKMNDGSIKFIMTDSMLNNNADVSYWENKYGLEGLKTNTRLGPTPILGMTPQHVRLGKSAKRPTTPADYMMNGFRILANAYKPDNIGGKIVNNLPFPCGIKGNTTYYLVNDTKDAVSVTAYGTKYISRMHGVIDCNDTIQTLGGERVYATLPWDEIKVVPPCLFYGLLDVYIPGKPDGFKDPRIMEETAKTVPSREEAEDAVRIIRNFGGFYDSADIEADKTARSIRNIIMRAYARVGAYGKWVFDQARSKAQSLPILTLDNYYTVSRAAFRTAMAIGVGSFHSREAWHLVKGIRSNALLAISANPFMLYRKEYASSRPEVDAIAYIGNGPGKEERELHVKDMLMLIGLMASCEPRKYPPYVPLFYEDMDPQWSDAADYWYIMVHKRNDSTIVE